MMVISQAERHEGRLDDEIETCRLPVSGIRGTQPKFTTGQDMAMAHRVVPRMESLSERTGCERRHRDNVRRWTSQGSWWC